MGLLWFSPTFASSTPYVSDEVCPEHIPDLTHGHLVSSLKAAETYVTNLIQEASQTCPLGSPVTTAPPIPTTTLLAPTTTLARPGTTLAQPTTTAP